MGSGEYGGNGSVHWYVSHKKDRNHGHGNRNYHEVDETPAAGGDFTIRVFDVEPGAVIYDSVTRTLKVTVPIKHHPTDYTRQLLIEWPDA